MWRLSMALTSLGHATPNPFHSHPTQGSTHTHSHSCLSLRHANTSSASLRAAGTSQLRRSQYHPARQANPHRHLLPLCLAPRSLSQIVTGGGQSTHPLTLSSVAPVAVSTTSPNTAIVCAVAPHRRWRFVNPMVHCHPQWVRQAVITGQRNQVFSPKEALQPMRSLPNDVYFA
jgi:hypothetical protein